MKMNSKKFECSLGFHEYTIPAKKYHHILMCKHCKKYGYYKDSVGSEHYYEYNENGDLIHYKRDNEFESYFEMMFVECKDIIDTLNLPKSSLSK